MRYPIALWLALWLLVPHAEIHAEPESYDAARAAMVRVIRSEFRATRSFLEGVRADERVFEAMGKVARHELIPEKQRPYAYENRPLPIGHGQTISQPYIVALMTMLLEPEPEDRMLEIGTGSGYQAAVLAELVGHVYSIEIIEALGKRARDDLRRLDYDNIATRIADGYYGWSAHAPYDGIVVTAAASHVPPPLIEQLKPGGRMVIPVGSRFMTQQLVLIEKDAKGSITTRQILPVRFVPLTGGP